MRRPTQNDKLKVYDQKGLTEGTAFLDNITEDEPEGCWSNRFDAASATVQLRNNVYPGLVAFAGVIPNAVFGYGYFGNGIRSDDLAFQLPMIQIGQ